MNAILDNMNEYFGNPIISGGFPGRFGYELFWPPYSLNLNPVRLIFKGVRGKLTCTETAPHS